MRVFATLINIFPRKIKIAPSPSLIKNVPLFLRTKMKPLIAELQKLVPWRAI